MLLQKLKAAARPSHRTRCSSGDHPSRKCARHPGRGINMPDRRTSQLARAKILSRYKTAKETMPTKSCSSTTRHRHNRANSTATRSETSRRRMISWLNRLRFSSSWTRLRTLLVKTSKATKQRAGCRPINLASNSSSCSRKPRPTRLIEELKINRWQMQINLTWHSEILARLPDQSKT
jgi:hypothetical protein